ncbi:MAG: Peptidoglycan glycosyltransferase [Pelosinus sp.]|jgi:peptidoglycan glycosyltransferase|nr:Peptidoglycan glycosyltransferase [Pelosinus sp.]
MRNDMKDLTQNIRKVAFGLLSLLVILFIYLSYIQVVQSEFLLTHPLNRRTIEAAHTTQYGMILDRNDEKLAYSKKEGDIFKRKYPYAAIAAQVVGYDSVTYGRSGMESAFNGDLTGNSTSVAHLGAISHVLGKKAGNNVTLTLDINVQETAYKALGNHKGAIVAINPKTGAILAMVSKPSFDPNMIDQQWKNISTDENSPLLNRVTQGLYPPGSTIKVMIAEAALKEKITDLKRTIFCEASLKIPPDYILQESHLEAYGNINLEKALAVSSNVFFGTLSLELGRNRMANTFERFGFNKYPVGQDLQEVASHLPKFSSLGDGDLAQTGIGQGSLLVTPLRMAMLTSSFANKGKIMKPYLVHKITDSDGNLMKTFTPEEWLIPTSSQLADEISKMMVGVVQNGTGSSASLPGVLVAGKTGTAENPQGDSHAWFIGFAPADNPQVAIAVIVENAGFGGSIAAPIARQVFRAALQ